MISPWAKPGHIEGRTYELSSVLKFIERVFGLPALASVNTRFDAATPGATSGPPAPPRDGRGDIGDLFECFTF